MGKKRKPKFVSPIKKGQYLLTAYPARPERAVLLKCTRPLGRDHAGEGIEVDSPRYDYTPPIWEELVNNGKIPTEEEVKLWLLQESMK